MALLEGLQELGDIAINIQKFRVLGGFCCYPDQKNAENPHGRSEVPPSTEIGAERGFLGEYNKILSLPWPTFC